MGVRGLREYLSRYIKEQESKCSASNKESSNDSNSNINTIDCVHTDTSNNKTHTNSRNTFQPTSKSETITVDNKTYISKTTYVDITRNLIQSYITFTKTYQIPPDATPQMLIRELLSYVSRKLVSFINKLSYNNKKLYIFTDVHDADIPRNTRCTMFREIIANKKFSKDELLRSRAVLPIVVVEKLLNNEYDIDYEMFVRYDYNDMKFNLDNHLKVLQKTQSP